MGIEGPGVGSAGRHSEGGRTGCAGGRAGRWGARALRAGEGGHGEGVACVRGQVMGGLYRSLRGGGQDRQRL